MSRGGIGSTERAVAKKRAYVLRRLGGGNVTVTVFSQADSVETPTFSSSDSACASCACVSFASGKCESRSSRRRLASEAVTAVASTTSALPGGGISEECYRIVHVEATR